MVENVQDANWSKRNMNTIKLYPSLEKQIKDHLPANVHGIMITQCPMCLKTSLCPGHEALSAKMYCNGEVIRFDYNIASAKNHDEQYFSNIKYYEDRHEVRRAVRKRITNINELKKMEGYKS